LRNPASYPDWRWGSSNAVFLAGDKEQVISQILDENLTPKKAQSQQPGGGVFNMKMHKITPPSVAPPLTKGRLEESK